MPVLHLKHPIKLSEKTSLEKLTFRDHTIAEDYLSFDVRGGVAQRIALIAALSGSDEAIIKRLHGVDYRRAVEIVDKIMEADEAFEETDAEKKSPDSLALQDS